MTYNTIEKPHALPEFSLMDTITSGQTFQWIPEDSIPTQTTNQNFPKTTSTKAYLLTRVTNQPVIFEVVDTGNTLQWRLLGISNEFIENNELYESHLKHRLGFSFPYEEALTELEEADPELAAEANTNLSLVQDPPFPTLISFICSPQAPLSRIYTMLRNIEQEYGQNLVVEEDHTMYEFPTPLQLETATEDILRDCSLGYRAPYVLETSTQVATQTPKLPPADTNMDTDELRTHLTKYMGVGEKVADCTLLYAYNRTEVTPVDTRIQQIVAERYDESVTTTQEAKQVIKNELPEEYCGYYQLLLYDLQGN